MLLKYSISGRSKTLRNVLAGVILPLAGQIMSSADPPSAPAKGDPAVMTINGEPVSASEYLLIMERQKASVYLFFKEHQNLDDRPGFWSEEMGPDGPLAKLRNATLEELIRVKVNQGLAKQKGLIQDVTYAAFRADFTSENARRVKALSAGDVVYGPRQYREATYYYKRFGDLVYQLTHAIGKEQDQKTRNKAIEQYYEDNKDSLGSTPLDDVMREKILTVLEERDYGQLMRSLYASAKVEINEPLLKPLVPRSDPA